MLQSRIAFLGSGNLASAIVRGLLNKESFTPSQIACTSKSGRTARLLAESTEIVFEPDLQRLISDADTIVIAFKPQSLAEADPSLRDLTNGKLVISVLAGKRLDRLAKTFPAARNLVRLLPNIPSSIGAGIAGWCSARELSPSDKEIVHAILEAMGTAVQIEEKYLDAITALGGSGPAFVFEFAAALRDGGVAVGLPADVARQFAVETLLGSARLLARTGLDPEALRDQVVSPNGTTFAGLRVMSQNKFQTIVSDAIVAATRRATELSGDT